MSGSMETMLCIIVHGAGVHVDACSYDLDLLYYYTGELTEDSLICWQVSLCDLGGPAGFCSW